MKIAIASGKGGTGKTTLATNLSAFMAEKEEVVLVDLDVEEPNSNLFVNGQLLHQETIFKQIPEWDETKCTLCNICTKVCNFHAIIRLGPSIVVFPELCHSCNACSGLCPEQALPMKSQKMGMLSEYVTQNLHFVEGRLDVGEEQAVPAIAKTKKYVRNKFNTSLIIIYDSPPGTSCPVIEAVKDADYIILVTEPTPFGLNDLRLAVETVKTLDIPFGVVINRHGIGDDKVEEYCRKEQIDILAIIPNNRKIAEHYSAGNLIYDEVPEIRPILYEIAQASFKAVKGGLR